MIFKSNLIHLLDAGTQNHCWHPIAFSIYIVSDSQAQQYVPIIAVNNVCQT